MLVRREFLTVDGWTAAINLGIGGIPEKVEIHNLEAVERISWYKAFHKSSTDQSQGWKTHGADGVVTVMAAAGGVSPFYGGNTITTATEAYKIKDPDQDKRTSTTYGTIDTWTLDTPGSKTGHWNVYADTTYVTIGSEVVINGKSYFITAFTTTYGGSAANEVTLNKVAPSGVIEFVGCKHNTITAPVGTIMPDGITIAYDTVVHANDNTMLVIAEW